MTGSHPAPISPSTKDVAIAGHAGDAITVERGLKSVDPAVRAVSLAALLRLGQLESAHLVAGFGDESEIVRRRSAELGARINDPAPLEAGLVVLLSDSDVIAEVSAFTLGEIGSENGIELQQATINALENQALNHTDALCREAAVASLGALHVGLEAILEACRDKATVRRRAIIALAPFDGPEVEAALRTALDDRDWQVRQAAEDLLRISADEVENDDEDDDGVVDPNHRASGDSGPS